jgi:hypothetical protein
MAAADAFDDGALWAGSPFAEDVVMGLPPRLVERGFAIIHSVKDDPRCGEAAVRDYFHRRRAA